MRNLSPLFRFLFKKNKPKKNLCQALIQRGGNLPAQGPVYFFIAFRAKVGIDREAILDGAGIDGAHETDQLIRQVQKPRLEDFVTEALIERAEGLAEAEFEKNAAESCVNWGSFKC